MTDGLNGHGLRVSPKRNLRMLSVGVVGFTCVRARWRVFPHEHATNYTPFFLFFFLTPAISFFTFWESTFTGCAFCRGVGYLTYSR